MKKVRLCGVALLVALTTMSGCRRPKVGIDIDIDITGTGGGGGGTNGGGESGNGISSIGLTPAGTTTVTLPSTGQCLVVKKWGISRQNLGSAVLTINKQVSAGTDAQIVGDSLVASATAAGNSTFVVETQVNGNSVRSDPVQLVVNGSCGGGNPTDSTYYIIPAQFGPIPLGGQQSIVVARRDGGVVEGTWQFPQPACMSFTTNGAVALGTAQTACPAFEVWFILKNGKKLVSKGSTFLGTIQCTFTFNRPLESGGVLSGTLKFTHLSARPDTVKLTVKDCMNEAGNRTPHYAYSLNPEILRVFGSADWVHPVTGTHWPSGDTILLITRSVGVTTFYVQAGVLDDTIILAKIAIVIAGPTGLAAVDTSLIELADLFGGEVELNVSIMSP